MQIIKSHSDLSQSVRWVKNKYNTTNKIFHCDCGSKELPYFSSENI